jgi:hypothetical protein
MTDASNLDDLAGKIASSSPNIKNYAKAQAAVTQSQETDIRKALAYETRIKQLEEDVLKLKGGGGQQGGGTPPPGGGTIWWDEDWTSASVPANWTTEVRNSSTTYAFVADPLGQKGTVLRLRCAYNSAQPTDYSSAGLQLVSLYRQASVAHSGYLTINEETWYRVEVMWPSGNAFSDGETNFVVEWHVDNGTQQFGNSSSIYTPGNFPLTSDGTSAPRGIGLRWNAGSAGNVQETYWPSSATGAYGNFTPITIVPNQWYDMLFHVVWSTNSADGLLEWWVDDVEKVSRSMQTLYTNPNNFNNQSYQTFGVYNYRYNITNDSNVYINRLAAGTTESSVS